MPLQTVSEILNTNERFSASRQSSKTRRKARHNNNMQAVMEPDVQGLKKPWVVIRLWNGFFVLCGFRDWQWHIHPLLPLSNGFFGLCGFRDWQWHMHPLLPLSNVFFVLCDFRDWQRHIHPLLPSVLHAPVPVANEYRQTVVQLQRRTSPLHQAGSLALSVVCTDLFTRTIGAYFVHQNFQNIWKSANFPQNTITNLSTLVLQFICFPVRNMPSFWFSVAHV